MAPRISSFDALHIFQELFGTVLLVVGLPVIRDIYHPDGREVSTLKT